MSGNLYAILASTIAWGGFYRIICVMNSKQQPEYSNRLMTLVHGLLMAILGVNQCFSEEGSPVFYPLQTTTDFQYFLLVTSLGYFIIDLIWCLYYQTETHLMLGHHVVSCIGLYVTALKTKSGGQICCSLGAMEITNPLLQTRWFIRTHGYQRTPIYATVEIVFMITFICTRLGFGTFFFLAVVTNKETPWDILILATAMYVISWCFMLNIYRYVKVKYTFPTRQPILDERSTYTRLPPSSD